MTARCSGSCTVSVWSGIRKLGVGENEGARAREGTAYSENGTPAWGRDHNCHCSRGSVSIAEQRAVKELHQFPYPQIRCLYPDILP
jgi:hypothetical protein